MVLAIKSVLLTLSLFITAIFISACSSGSSGGKASVGSFTPGMYDFVGEINDVHCSDGSSFRQGYGAKGELTLDGEFLTLKSAGKAMGRGHLTANGGFHLSGALEDGGYTIAISMDGARKDAGFAGTSEAVWNMDGVNCQQSAGFTAMPVTGGA